MSKKFFITEPLAKVWKSVFIVIPVFTGMTTFARASTDIDKFLRMI